MTTARIMDVRPWALEKHRLLTHYVEASWAARRKWPVRTLIDLYCGPGKIRVKGESEVHDGGVVRAYKASLKPLGGAFTDVVIGDADHEYVESCADELKSLGANVHCLVGTAEETSKMLARSSSRFGISLAYLDPFNISSLPFSVIQNLSRIKSVDFLIHYSLMDVNRNFELDFTRGDESKFDAFAPGWRDHIDLNALPLHRARGEFLSYWLRLLEGLGFTNSKEMPLMRNEKRNAPLYRLILLSRHPLAENLWNDIAKSPQRALEF